MQTIRSFIAIPIADEIRRRVERFVNQLQTIDEGAVKWVPMDNLHLTLKFLGDVDNRLVPDVCKALRNSVAESSPFELSFQGGGGFPDLYRARVLWVDIPTGQDELTPLVARLEDRLAAIGFKREPRAYRAHLTIGRLKTGRRPGAELIDKIAESHAQEFGEMTVDEIQVIASYLEKKGPTYTVMDRISL